MSIKEVFSNPTVKQVVFQIRYPNLFTVENKIGDFQLKIMEKFTESDLMYKRQVVWADVGPQAKLEAIPSEFSDKSGYKYWQFRTKDEVVLNVLTDSLDISSKTHKTYNHEGVANKFRDTIQFVINAFLEIYNIPKISRMGLRYVDECPVKSKVTEEFKKCYNSILPLDRFDIIDATYMEGRLVTKKGNHFLNYMELFQDAKSKLTYTLDFDAYSLDVNPISYLITADELHELISEEFEHTIKEPVINFMRTGNLEIK